MSTGPIMGERYLIPFQINATDLAAGTAQNLVGRPGDYVVGIRVIVQAAIGTGGDITVKGGSDGNTAVAGLSVTVEDSAAAGTVYADRPTPKSATQQLGDDGRIQVIPASAFATSGAVNGYIEMSSSQYVNG